MNSDKLDTFIKEQIDSLDRVEVPGTQWNKQASWDKISGRNRKRKTGIFWMYFSGVAAFLLLLISFWFSSFNWDDLNVTEPIKGENKFTSEFADETENAEKFRAKATMEIMEEISTANQKTLTENYIAVEEPSAEARQSEPLLAILPRLIPQKQAPPIKTAIEVNEKPILRSFAIGQGSKQPDDLAFNRTYIIRKKSESKPLDPAPGLTLSINMPVNSKIDPPTGSLSRLK